MSTVSVQEMKGALEGLKANGLLEQFSAEEFSSLEPEQARDAFTSMVRDVYQEASSKEWDETSDAYKALMHANEMFGRANDAEKVVAEAESESKASSKAKNGKQQDTTKESSEPQPVSENQSASGSSEDKKAEASDEKGASTESPKQRENPWSGFDSDNVEYIAEMHSVLGGDDNATRLLKQKLYERLESMIGHDKEARNMLERLQITDKMLDRKVLKSSVQRHAKRLQRRRSKGSQSKTARQRIPQDGWGYRVNTQRHNVAEFIASHDEGVRIGDICGQFAMAPPFEVLKRLVSEKLVSKEKRNGIVFYVPTKKGKSLWKEAEKAQESSSGESSAAS